MKYLVALLLSCAALRAQSFPIAIGPNPHLSLPAVDHHGLTALVASSVSPDGEVTTASDLYLVDAAGNARRLTNLPNNGATWVDLSADGSRAAYNVTASTPPGMEEIHVVDTASGADQRVAVDTSRCIQPLNFTVCIGCYFSCVRSVHLSPDASKVVYTSSEAQPLYVVNADGPGVVHLPIEGAGLATPPQRVVSRNGLLVFTAGQNLEDVYVAKLDGSGVQNLTNFPAGNYASNATISEDGGTIAFVLSTPNQIFVLHPGGAPQRLTTDPNGSSGPSLSADGSTVAFVAGGQAFFQRTDGSGPPTRLTNFNYLTANAVALSGDGSTALVTVEPFSGNGNSAVYTVGTGTKAKQLYAPEAVLPFNGIQSFSGAASPSAGSLFRISGWNFQDDTVAFASVSPLPSWLGGVSVEVNGQRVPVLEVTPSQITAQLPFTTPAGQATFAVDFGGDFAAGKQLTATAEVKNAAPEVLQYVTPFFSSIYARAFHAGTSTVADQGHPASAGEALEMYGTGLGAVNPAVDAGMPAPSDPPAHAVAVPQVKIGGQNATVTFAGLAPGQVGIYQVNAVVPSGLKSGSQPVSWSVSGQPPQVTWSIWVK